MRKIINGKKVAKKIRDQISAETSELKSQGIIPNLVVIIVGENLASQVYVRNKEKQAKESGMDSTVIRLPESISQTELLKKIEIFNNDSLVHGILVQLPLPSHIKENTIIKAINPLKDVDGFHPENIGKMVIGEKAPLPCTPAGIIELLKDYKVELSGKNAVIIGRSNIVGKPMFHLLLQANATVTICHSKTKNLATITKTADIIIVAIGKANFLTKQHLNPNLNPTIIDVGINRLKNGKLAGDVNFKDVCEISSLITPVPGGVGPMTIAMLLKNTLTACKQQTKEG